MKSIADLIRCIAPGTYHFGGQYWLAEIGLDHRHEFAFECEMSYEQDFVFAYGELDWAAEADIPGFSLSIPINDHPPSVISVALTLPNIGTLGGRAFFTGHSLETILHSELATLSSHIRILSQKILEISGIFENQEQHYGFVLTCDSNDQKTTSTSVAPFSPRLPKPKRALSERSTSHGCRLPTQQVSQDNGSNMSGGDCFVFLDFETTGLDENSDRVIEVAAVRSTFSGEEVGHYHTLINPGIPVPPFITKLTGLDTPTIQRSGITPWQAINELLKFINGDIVVAFNAEFDIRFLLAEAKRAAINIDKLDYVCALASAQKAWPLFRRHNLKALSVFFGLPEQQHRALDDCRNGCRIFLYSSSAIGKNQIADSLQLDKMCVTSLDIEALYSCKSGDRLTLWTKPNLPTINAYAPGSLAGSGLVVSLGKEKNEWLLQQMSAGRIKELGVQREIGESYEIFPITTDAQPVVLGGASPKGGSRF